MKLVYPKEKRYQILWLGKDGWNYLATSRFKWSGILRANLTMYRGHTIVVDTQQDEEPKRKERPYVDDVFVKVIDPGGGFW